MKIVKSIVALGLLLGILTSALADTPKHIGRAATVNGIIARMDGHDLVVRVKQPTGEPKELTFPTDDNTEVRVDGDAGTVDDLRPDMIVQITSAVRNVPGPARLVKATSKSLSGVVMRLDGRNLGRRKMVLPSRGGFVLFAFVLREFWIGGAGRCSGSFRLTWHWQLTLNGAELPLPDPGD